MRRVKCASSLGFGAFLCFLFLLADLAVSVTALRDRPGIPAGLYVQDQDRPYAMAQNVAISIDEGVAYTVRTNERGYRDDAWTLNATIRVLVLGDGMATGAGGPSEDAFPAKAGRLLERANVRLYNAAVGGYGLHENLATLKRECAFLRPTLVLTAYWYDDMLPVASAPSTVAAQTDKPISSYFKLAHLRAWLSYYGWHPTQIAERIWGLADLDASYLARYLKTGHGDFLKKERAEAAADIVLKMQAEANACGSGFALAVLPTFAEAYYGLREPATQNLLAAIGSSVNVLDIRNHIPLGSRLMSGLDNHYDRFGNEMIAGILADFVGNSLALSNKP
ncbi:MAG: hypothetical protein HQL44_04940 [Alphaproteobacteria bacterium]|nr:hypothetical protein [Alphaproteobacteria bacterium]